MPHVSMTEPWCSSDVSRPYSHPPEDGNEGTYLVDHLEDVASRVDYVVQADDMTPSGESLRSVVETLAYLHDIGKATTYFQQYLRTGASPDNDRLRHHAPLGSFAAYYALDVQGFDTETSLAGFVAVAKHHGRLPNVADYVFQRSHRRDGIAGRDQNEHEKRQTDLVRQIKDIDANAPMVASQIFEDATAEEGDWEQFRDGFLDLLEDIEQTVATSGVVPEPREDAVSNSWYGLALRTWSALVLADKTSAAGAPSHEGTYAAEYPSTDRLDAHVEQLEAGVQRDLQGDRKEKLNHFRGRARRAVLDAVPKFHNSDGAVATLTLPTGMGKTLTGLSAAQKLRDLGENGRIVYALPFTSIIDQVVDEIEEIYETDGTDRLLTAHHHLAETTIRGVRDEDDADLSDDVAGMLAESWRAGLTVTTFVQLFESLAGPTNRQSMKLPALRDAIVVLDEPQSLPLDWWKLAPRLIQVLTEQYGATVLAMTATQPRLFDSDAELVDDPGVYFNAVNRVTYKLDESTERYISSRSEPKTYSDAAHKVRDGADSGQSTLAICNTIDSARELTEHVDGAEFTDVASAYDDELQAAGQSEDVDPEVVAERVVSNGERALLHLTTRLRPADRLTLIETAKHLTKRNHPLVTVATQLIEAGVDISFDTVYRDLAPIDSIVQAAGRCNRSFEQENGEVTVWWLDSPGDQSKTPAEAVYNRGTTRLPTVANTLHNIRGESATLSETDVARRAVETYFKRLREDKNVGKQEYAGLVDEAKAQELGKLSLIDERRSAEVIVSRTPAEREAVEQIRAARKNYEYDTLDSLLDETKPLRLSIPYYSDDSEVADAITDLPSIVEDEGIYELDVRHHPSHFDETTGFVVPGKAVDHQFL